MDLGLAGRACVVTGASSGIGRETARRLAAEGAHVLLVARGEERLASAVEEVAAGGDGEAAGLALDVTDADAGERMLAAAQARFGRLDVLVNNAGFVRLEPLEQASDEEWRRQYELCVMAPLRAMRAAVPAMAEAGWGRVVNVCSASARRPSQAAGPYSAAKAAELSLSRLFADRYAARGVLVNAVCPGSVESELWMRPGGLLDQARRLSGSPGGKEESPGREAESPSRGAEPPDRETEPPSRDEALAAATAAWPIGRLAEVGEIAAAIVFLCSAAASYVSGAAWSVDGGAVPLLF